jgi:triacylglycerol esterase/lipase EstA (alpha/beta hydrolase family)
MANTPSLRRFAPSRQAGGVVDVIFVHGLGGDAVGTWSVGGQASEAKCWPAWLAEDLPSLCVLSLDYEAEATRWVGRGMGLEDRATNILTLFETEGVGTRPIAFICYSLGGLIVKQMLRNASDSSDQRWARILKQTRSLFFIATPHAGAGLANVMNLFRVFTRPNDSAEALKANSAMLANLNQWYRDNAKGIVTYCFYEGDNVAGIKVVDRASADIGMQGVVLRPIDASHISICNPNRAMTCCINLLRRG